MMPNKSLEFFQYKQKFRFWTLHDILNEVTQMWQNWQNLSRENWNNRLSITGFVMKFVENSNLKIQMEIENFGWYSHVHKSEIDECYPLVLQRGQSIRLKIYWASSIKLIFHFNSNFKFRFFRFISLDLVLFIFDLRHCDQF